MDIEQMIGTGLSAAAWSYFAFFVPWRVQATGVAAGEPPLFLYGGTFKALRFLALLLFVAPGWFYGRDLYLAALDALVPFILAAIDAVVIGGLILALVVFYTHWRARAEEVVIEPMAAQQVVLRIVVVLAALALLAATPWALSTFTGGAAPDDLIASLTEDADAGVLVALVQLFVFFWAIPKVLEARWAREDDEMALWRRSTGLEIFRLTWLGLILVAGLGFFTPIPGLDAFFPESPMSLEMGILLPFVGAAIFALWWAWPMHAVWKQADAGDFLAKELQSDVRFVGLPAWLRYRGRSRKRGTRFQDEAERQLCPTCLRPVNQIEAYPSLKFDECPHCGSFIPPVFTLYDYVRLQSDRLAPFLDSAGDKKKKPRGVDESRLVQDLLRGLLAMTVADRGTDLHFVTEGDRFVVRCRTDGVLYTLIDFPPAMARSLVSAIKVRCNLDIAERRKPQDGSFQMEVGDKAIDIRVNTSPVPGGEMAAARLLYQQEALGSLDKLGMNARNVSLFARLIARPSGLILVTGPTGSGKSTTLYNALESIATGERNIITLEDPIEYKVSGLTQMQINPKKGFTFATGLKTILRQDPDVIMVGEIRDQETAKMAIDAAATGHLVFSTLHAVDTIAVQGRVKDLGIEITRYADVMLLVLAQRLVRLTCPRCSEAEDITREQLAIAGLPGAPQPKYSVVRGKGCPHCHETGYRGREGIYEFFSPNDELRAMMGRGDSLQSLRRRARALGMRTILEDGLTKVLLGRTTLEEVMRVTS